MADNITLNSGSGGATLAADDIASVWYPKGKVVFGANDSATDVTTTAGLPVQPQTSSTWAVTDNSGSLTVDAPVGTPVFVRLSDGSAAITTLPVSLASVPSHAVTNAGTFAVQVDGSALTALQLIDNPVFVDDAAFTPATSSVMMAGFEYDDTTPDSVDEGDAGAARMSARREIYTQIRDAAGNERGVNVNASNQMSVSVDNTVTVASHAVTNAGTFAVQATCTNAGTFAVQTGAERAEDAAHSTGHTGLFVLAVRADSAASTAGTDGDYAALTTDSTGRLWCNVSNTLTVASHAVTNAGTFAVQVDGSALTALQLIDDIVRSEDEASAGGHSGAVVLARRTDTPANQSGTDGDYEFLQVSAGRLWASATIDAALPAGTNAIGKLAANSGVDIGDVDVTSVTPGTGASSLGKAEDAAHTTGDTGVFLLAVRSDSAAATGGTDGDYTALVTDSTGRLWCNVSNTLTVASHAVTNAGTFAVQVDGSALTALQLIDNTILVDDAAFTPATSSVNMAGFQADETATDSVDEGDAGAARMTLDRKQIVTPQPHTAGGLSIFRSLDLDETEEDVKTSAGQLYGGFITNLATATRFVKFYNATAANVTVGSTTPVITIGIPGNATDDIGATFNAGGMGIAFDTAICVAATTGIADADTGAPGANDVLINLWYK